MMAAEARRLRVVAANGIPCVAVTTILVRQVDGGWSEHVFVDIMFIAIGVHVSLLFEQCAFARKGAQGALPNGMESWPLFSAPSVADGFGGRQTHHFCTLPRADLILRACA